MDERKNKMTDERYREILPVAYMTAAIEKGRQPRPVEVGLCARAIVECEGEESLAYRVAMATKIHCTIVGVKRVPTKANSDKYEIAYRTLNKDEDEMIPSPLLNGFPLGKVAEWLWGRKNDDGTNYWVGRRAVLYKHNDPPKEGDMSSAGYRCCVIDFDTYVTDPEKYDGFLIYDKSNGKVVCDTCVDELHSDIVSYYDFFDGVDIRVIEDDGIFVDVDFGRSSIVVENGRWYISNFC